MAEINLPTEPSGVGFNPPNWSRSALVLAAIRLLVAGCGLWLFLIAYNTPSQGHWRLSGTDKSQIRQHDDPQVIAVLTPHAASFCGVAGMFFAALTAEAWLAGQLIRKGSGLVPGGFGPRGAVVQNLLQTTLVSTASLSIASLVAAGLVGSQGLKTASAEGGPLELIQAVGWLLAAVLSVFFARRVTHSSCRAGLLLLGLGALLAAAREIDLHERINPAGLQSTAENLGVPDYIPPQTVSKWGVRFRVDWWFSAKSPIGPRLLWATVFAAFGVAALISVRRGAGSLLKRGAPLNRLVPLLGVVAAMLFFGWAADDLLRYRVPLRQAQIFEEAVELAAVLVFLSMLGWAVRLARDASSQPAQEPA